MLHINLSKHFVWSSDPFPAYRVNISFGGAAKSNRRFLPVKDVKPLTDYTVVYKNTYSPSKPPDVLYKGPSEEEAKRIHDKEISKGKWPYLEANYPYLPTNQFKVIKTQEKGTIMVVPGEDLSNRALLFASVDGGFRGGCRILTRRTTAQVLLECSAFNACDSRIAVAAILEVGQQLVFQSWGRRNHDVIVYSWDGGETATVTRMTTPEWNALHEPTDGDSL